MDVVPDCVGANCDVGDGFPSYEQNGVAREEVTLCC